MKAHVTCTIQSAQYAVTEKFDWYFGGTLVSSTQYPVGQITKAEYDVPEYTSVKLVVTSLNASGQGASSEVSMDVGAYPGGGGGGGDPLPQGPTLGGLVIESWVDG